MYNKTIRQLLTARQRDLADVELDIEKYSAKLVALKAERGEIIEDIKNLKERLYDESNVNNEE